MKIYVDLLDEGTRVRCPVEAVHLKDDLFQIIEVNADPEGTRWAFDTGSKVRCKATLTSDMKETILVTYETIPE